ncbi:MAG: bifunctional riboflavin kinase/FAD synthetase [Lachnospiraceae bacterium]|nr:bifunctional riboflavin kinase/FAD synthetase [Lachnospiraceae bacterium]
MLRIFSDISIPPTAGRAVALGKFDGIHLGHLKLLDTVLSFRSEGLYPLVCTFAEPLSAVFSDEEPLTLTTNEERMELFRDMGIEEVFFLPVDDKTLSTPPEAFVRHTLVETLHASVVVSGPDCSFGRGGKGDLALLRKMADELKFRVVSVDKVLLNGEPISSSRIRFVLKEGKMEEVRALLGRDYSVGGRVRHGRKLGRRIEMPTVNLIPPEGKLLPPFGVYEVRVMVGSESFEGVANLGVKPTVSGDRRVTLESHIFDFDEDLYGEEIEVRLLHFERPEWKFDSVKQLKSAMHSDMLVAKRFFQRKGTSG